LQQIGMDAKFSTFESRWAKSPENRSKLQDESRRISEIDISNRRTRASLSPRERWRVELQEAFSWISKIYTAITTHDILGADVTTTASSNRKHLEESIGKFGFKRLILDGKLLNLPQGISFELFAAIDSQRKGFLGFAEVLSWFEHEAEAVLNGKSAAAAAAAAVLADFSVSSILSCRTRAYVSFFRRLAIIDLKTMADERSRGVDAMSLYAMNRMHDGDDDDDSGGSSDEDSLAVAKGINIKSLTKGDAYGDDINGKLMLKLRIK